MEEKFTYEYSASVNKEVQQIRERYLPRQESRLEQLKRLDSQVQQAGMMESLSLGILGILIFGVAMCMGLEVLPGNMVFAVLLAVVGTVLMFLAYPAYITVAKKVREDLTPQILQLADEIEKQ